MQCTDHREKKTIGVLSKDFEQAETVVFRFCSDFVRF